MMAIDDVVANDLDIHLESSNLAVVFGNSMSDHDFKDYPFYLYGWIVVLWISCGVLISM
jgi:hypothetical protein